MAKECSMSFQQRSLFQQGFQRFSPEELKQLEWGLRFTPAACSLIAAYGLYVQQPYILFAVAALGIWAFFFPAAHPMDLIYNHMVRPLFGAVKLPENPLQRRLACLSAGLMNIAAGTLFIFDMPIVATVVGVSLLFLQAIVIFTHFCTLSWMYEGVMRLAGKWQKPIEISQAQSFLSNGAKLIDVRSQNEFAKDSLVGAINLPLEDLEHLVDEFKQGICLLFCNSGTRSHIASEKLKGHGVNDIYNLGDLTRAKEIVAANA